MQESCPCLQLLFRMYALLTFFCFYFFMFYFVGSRGLVLDFHSYACSMRVDFCVKEFLFIGG